MHAWMFEYITVDALTEVYIQIWFHRKLPKSASVLFENVDEGFYEERRRNYDMNLKVRDARVMQILRYVTLGRYWWGGLTYAI